MDTSCLMDLGFFRVLFGIPLTDRDWTWYALMGARVFASCRQGFREKNVCSLVYYPATISTDGSHNFL